MFYLYNVSFQLFSSLYITISDASAESVMNRISIRFEDISVQMLFNPCILMYQSRPLVEYEIECAYRRRATVLSEMMLQLNKVCIMQGIYKENMRYELFTRDVLSTTSVVYDQDISLS